jgi:hypothetical protein
MIRIPEKFKHLWPADKPGARIDRLVSTPPASEAGQ